MQDRKISFSGSMVLPLAAWFLKSARDLPWRKTKDPYRIWVSEIMLQQTRVEAVKAYHERFLQALPDIPHLAECPEDDLLKLWEGLGYYSRVRNLQKAARQILERHGGAFPGEEQEILDLPGIGSYTCGAVGSIAFGLPLPAVDGNVLRVCARLSGSFDDIGSAKVKKDLEVQLRSVLADLPESVSPGTLNQALMELGALVCVPNGAPKCGDCPLADRCSAHLEQLTEEIPVKKKTVRHREEERTVLIIRDGARTAIRKRPPKGLLAGVYEFPNLAGRLTSTAAREFAADLGFRVESVRPLPDAKHVFSHVTWKMAGYEIRIAPAEDTKSLLFAERSEMEEKYPIPSAFAAYTKELAVRIGKEGKQREDEDTDRDHSVL